MIYYLAGNMDRLHILLGMVGCLSALVVLISSAFVLDKDCPPLVRKVAVTFAVMAALSGTLKVVTPTREEVLCLAGVDNPTCPVRPGKR